MTLTPEALAGLQRVSDPWGILTLLTITGAGIPEPLRLVSDTRNLVSAGHTYIGLEFDLIPPREAAKEIPRAQLRITNTGRDITQLLEALPAGEEYTAAIAYVYRKQPNVQFRGFAAPMSGFAADPLYISASMGPGELLRRSVTNVRYDPVTAPGLFPD